MVSVVANFLRWLCDGKQVVPEGLHMRASQESWQNILRGCRVLRRNAVQIVFLQGRFM